MPPNKAQLDRPTAIHMEHVSFHRAGQLAPTLSTISLSIPAGQWVSLAGSNGSGKSTLVRLLNGLLPMSSGRITIDGIPLSQDSLWDVRSRIGMVFAHPDDQFVGLTVADDIAFGLENQRLSRDEMIERIHRYANRLRIHDLLDRHPATLSGGQKQRVALAAVLAMEPSILILDEAASMLDASFRSELLHIMKELITEGKHTIISISHDWEEIAAADRMLILSDGELVADGSPSELLKQEHYLEICRLQPPYPLQLCKELQAAGIPIGWHTCEQEVYEALCAWHSNKSALAIATEE